MSELRPHSHIRSFVRRAGRMTAGQRRAIEAHWARLGVEPEGMLDLPDLFTRSAPIIVEVGFGAGENLLAAAARRPDRNFLGIEVHEPGVGQVLAQANELGLENVRVICDDAAKILRQCIADAALDSMWVFYPDPWPKKRHHKRRLVSPGFGALAASKLRPGGTLHLATDWEDYALAMLEALDGVEALVNAAGPGTFAARFDERIDTRFAQRGERLGHGTWDLAYRRRD